MSPALMTLVAFGLMLVLLLIGLPVCFGIMASSVVLLFAFKGLSSLSLIQMQIYGKLTEPSFLAVPLFIFMAAVLESSGIGGGLYNTMYKWFGGLRGGLAIGTVAICTLIAAMTGISATGTVTMGILAYPEMRKRGYSNNLALGCIPPAGVLGILIPPSVPLIILGSLTYLSIGKLFMGGVFPGLLMSFLFMLYIAISCYFRPKMGPALPPEERANWQEKFRSLYAIIFPVLLIVMVLGGIYSGICTPTEAGGVGALGTIICAAVYRNLNWQMLKDALTNTFLFTSMIMMLVIAGSSFAAMNSALGISQFISGSIAGMQGPPMAIIVLMLVIVLVMGCVMDSMAIMLTTLHIFMPVVYQLGFDPLWFVLSYSIALAIGLVTPPYGMDLFYLKGVVPPDVKMADIFRGTPPFVVLMVLTLIIGVVWPPVLTWLPSVVK